MQIRNDPEEPTQLRVPLAEAEQLLRERIDNGEQLLGRHVNDVREIKAYIADHRRWSDVNKELLRRLFTTDAELNRYQPSSWPLGHLLTPTQEYSQERKETERNIERLRSLLERLQFIDVASAPGALAGNDSHQTVPQAEPMSREVFVVHGHDDAAKQSVARFLMSLGLKPIILSEQANRTRTVLEKFEQHAASAAFAVVLLTADDVGGSGQTPDKLKPRARQNVVLELGYFLGAWKRSRVCALHSGAIELPSDLHGLVYIEMDTAGGWQLLLAKELDAAGIEIDPMSLLRY